MLPSGTMNGLTYQGVERLAYEAVEDPRIESPEDAILEIEVAGLCGSDLHVYHGRETGLDVGTVMGHEYLGRVVEVGPEVRAAFVDKDRQAASCFVENARGRWQADLYGLARQRLASAGVGQVYGGDFCTFRDSERFFSYRRDGQCGRMASFVLRKP